MDKAVKIVLFLKSVHADLLHLIHSASRNDTLYTMKVKEFSKDIEKNNQETLSTINSGQCHIYTSS